LDLSCGKLSFSLTKNPSWGASPPPALPLATLVSGIPQKQQCLAISCRWQGRERKNEPEGFALPPAVSRCLELLLGLNACRYATVWQKYEVKIKREGSKSRFKEFLAKKRGLMESGQRKGLKTLFRASEHLPISEVYRQVRRG
jgi:hypothetical protein